MKPAPSGNGNRLEINPIKGQRAPKMFINRLSGGFQVESPIIKSDLIFGSFDEALDFASKLLTPGGKN